MRRHYILPSAIAIAAFFCACETMSPAPERGVTQYMDSPPPAPIVDGTGAADLGIADAIGDLQDQVSALNREYLKMEKEFSSMGDPEFFRATGLDETIEQMEARRNELEKTDPDSTELAQLNRTFDALERELMQGQAKQKRFDELNSLRLSAGQRRADLLVELNKLKAKQTAIDSRR